MIQIGKGADVVAAEAAFASKDPVGFLGWGLLGSLVVVFFLGILTLQGAAYFKAFPDDCPWLRRLVCINIVLSVAQTLTVVASPWRWFVTHYGDWKVVISFPWTITAEVIIAQLTITLAQFFFAYRCFVLTQRNRIILAILTGGIGAGLLLYVGVGVALIIDPYNSALSLTLAIPALCITICTDMLITGLITWKLLASKTGVNESTDSGLSKLLRVTWEAAAPPAIATVLNLIVILTLKTTNFVYCFLNVLIPRLYIFSMMYTLNSRPEVRNVFNGADRSDLTTRSASLPSESPLSSKKRSPQHLISTRIVFAHIGSEREDSTVFTSDTIGVIDERVGEGGGHCHDFLGDSAADLHLQIDLDKWEEVSPFVQPQITRDKADNRSNPKEEDIDDSLTMRTIRERGGSKLPSPITGTGLV